MPQTRIVSIWQSFTCLCLKRLEIDYPPHVLREKLRAHALIHLSTQLFLFSLGPVFSFNNGVAELYSVMFITSSPAKEHSAVNPDGTQKTLQGMVFRLFCCPQKLNFIFTQSSGFFWLFAFACTTELLSFGRQSFSGRAELSVCEYTVLLSLFTQKKKKRSMLVNSEVSLSGSKSIVSVLLNYVLLKQSELKACQVLVVVSVPVV